MRRAALLTGLVALAVGGVLLATRSQDGSKYRVAAIFDTAKGMVAGQQVKIAGAVVGKVQEVELAPGPKARMVLTIDRRFEPFRADATCKILPEGLISENYLECDPGTPPSGSLRVGEGGLPTVGVERTAVPVSLQDFINVFTMPVNQRLRVLVNELGLATAGRGEDLNAILRRANPALGQSRRVLSIIERQRRQLAAAVGETDAVLAQLGRRDRDVRTFVDRAATVAGTTARHRAALGEAVRRLPAMLDAVRPGLRSLDRAAASASPLLDDLRASAPGLRKLSTTLPAFTQAGTPAVHALAAAARKGRPDIRATRPVISHLRNASIPVKPLAGDLAKLLISTRDKGGIEGTMKFLYTFANISSMYDRLSHVLTFHASVAPECIAAENAGVDLRACSHKYSAPGQGTIPINSPGCGPQGSEHLWNNFRCGNGFPGFGMPAAKPAGRAGPHRALDPRRIPTAPGLPRLNLPVPALRSSGGVRTNRDPVAKPLERLLDYLLK